MFVAPLVAPAVDLTVLGLLVGTLHLALAGASDDALRPARHLLLATSVVTLFLNVADPVFAGHWGKAAFDSVGPLLIGWAEAGPGLLRALNTASADPGIGQPGLPSSEPKCDRAELDVYEPTTVRRDEQVAVESCRTAVLDEELVERARRADADHWRRYRCPISAETLRKQLRVGATMSRSLVTEVRLESAPASLTCTELEGT